jgi:2Fe-2S ferredoxin
MIKINFIGHTGTHHRLEAVAGHSVMEVAVRNGIAGIDAQCGGACSCATCHVYVDAQWTDHVPPVTATEEMMLEFVEDQRPESRLACQLMIDEALDGLTVRIPASQREF